VRGNRLFTKRLLTKTNRVPKWGEHFVNARTVKIVEESITDPNEKILITYTRNIGYSRVMVIVFNVLIYNAVIGMYHICMGKFPK
jgi:hypothetical protein